MYMSLRETFILFLYLSSLFFTGFFTGAASASGDYIVSPTGATNDQDVINKAIEEASENGGGTVYLNPGVYLVDGPVIIKSNIHLTGDPNAIIRVAPTSSQWFTGQIGVICNPTESVHNVEISGFQIDGNIANLPKSYANSRSDTRHDCEKLIILGGWSSNFGSNIKIHGMKLYNAFSDGIYIRFSKGVACYNNFISNCQHEGIFFSCVLNGTIYKNKIAGITSDCARLDNCQNCKIHDNIFFAYTGDSYGAYKGGHNGLQIGNAGVSHGYDARNKPFKTKNIEVYNNIFSDPGLRAIWYHGGENVYIHDNKFVNAEELETMGIPVGDISFENQPTVEMSEKVFGGLLEILNIDFVDNARNNQTEDSIKIPVEKKGKGKIRGGITIAGFADVVYKNGVPYIPDNESVLVKAIAMPSPANTFNAGVHGIEKQIEKGIENGEAYAKMTVTMHYTVSSKNSKGEKVTKLKTTKEVFEAKRVPAPAVLPRPDKVNFRIDQHIGIKNYTTVAPYPSVPEGLQRVEYEYNGKMVKNVLEVGERIRGDNGIIHTNITEVNYWDGDLDHFGDGLYIEGEFEQDKLKIRAYTIYEEIPTESEYFLHEYKAQRLLSFENIIVILKICLTLFALYQLLKIVF
jgi:hypothetical protein